MELILSKELEDYVNRKVSDGSYRSETQVVQEALRLQKAYDQVNEAKLLTLQKDVLEGIDATEKGDTKDGSACMKNIKSDLLKKHA